MKSLLVFLLMILLFSISEAAIFRVANGGTQPYSQVQPAISAASAGDTILLFPGTYNGFIVNRRLVIIGAGTSDLGEGTRITGVVEVNDAADSTELRSLWIQTAVNTSYDSTSSALVIHSGAMEILVWRCFMANSGSSAVRCAWAGNSTNSQWVQCVFWTSLGSAFGLSVRSSSFASLTSCAFSSINYGIEGNNTSGTIISARHCVFSVPNNYSPFSTTAYGTAENCAFLASIGSPSYTGAANISYSYCAGAITAPPGATNLVTTSAAFQNFVWNNPRTSDYHLSATSNLRDAGRPDSLGGPPDLDSTRADIGIYGGQHPFVDGGIPDYPFMIRLDAPFTVPQNGVMRIWARGQVGPGY
jgi:hypothetical protein